MSQEENVTGAAKFRTKIRRLYDIANVLTALGIVEKATALPQKKPYFRWLGPEAALVVLYVLCVSCPPTLRIPLVCSSSM